MNISFCFFEADSIVFHRKNPVGNYYYTHKHLCQYSFLFLRCKDTNLFLFGKIIFSGQSFGRFSQRWRAASRPLCSWRCSSSLEGNSVISIDSCKHKLHQALYKSCKRFDVLSHARLLQSFHIFLTATHGNHYPWVARCN